MANIPTTQIWIEDSIYLFLEHYKWGWEEYSLSSVLVDPWYNIISFFDRWTERIFSIQAWLDYNHDVIIANWKKIKVSEKIKYSPLDYDMVIAKRKETLDKLKKEKDEEGMKAFYKKVRDEVDAYNINYFTNLMKNFKGIIKQEKK